MTHFFTIVLVPGDTELPKIEEKVAALLHPYYEGIEDNKQATWDWWRIGGRYDGWMRNENRPSTDNGFNFSEGHEELAHNSILAKQIDHKISCLAVVTPDGKWHERGKIGWFGYVDESKQTNEEWEEQVTKCLQHNKDCIAVGVDCHI